MYSQFLNILLFSIILLFDSDHYICLCLFASSPLSSFLSILWASGPPAPDLHGSCSNSGSSDRLCGLQGLSVLSASYGFFALCVASISLRSLS